MSLLAIGHTFVFKNDINFWKLIQACLAILRFVLPTADPEVQTVSG